MEQYPPSCLIPYLKLKKPVNWKINFSCKWNQQGKFLDAPKAFSGTIVLCITSLSLIISHFLSSKAKHVSWRCVSSVQSFFETIVYKFLHYLPTLKIKLQTIITKMVALLKQHLQTRHKIMNRSSTGTFITYKSESHFIHQIKSLRVQKSGSSVLLKANMQANWCAFDILETCAIVCPLLPSLGVQPVFLSASFSLSHSTYQLYLEPIVQGLCTSKKEGYKIQHKRYIDLIMFSHIWSSWQMKQIFLICYEHSGIPIDPKQPYNRK